MNTTHIDSLIGELLELSSREDRYPFPTEDCRKLLREHREYHQDFVTHLDLYFSDIAGYASWGKKIVNWSNDAVEKAKAGLEKNFFQKYSQYSFLEPLITEKNTNNLFKALRKYESIRNVLLRILSEL